MLARLNASLFETAVAAGDGVAMNDYVQYNTPNAHKSLCDSIVEPAVHDLGMKRNITSMKDNLACTPRAAEKQSRRYVTDEASECRITL